MRILHVLGERAHAGGEVQLEHVLAALRDAGHESRMVIQPGAAFGEAAARLEVSCLELRMRNGFDLFAARRLRTLLRAESPDLLHLADARTHKLGMLATWRGPRPPIVVTRRLADRLRRGRFTRWAYGRADAVVAISEATAEAVAAAGIRADRIHVIPDGIDPARFAGLEAIRQDARAALDLADDALVILCAATLGSRKGQAHLVRAFADLHPAVPRAVLVLAGEGPEAHVLENQVRELGLEGAVRLPGRIDVRRALAAADIACVPSLMEGLSVFALEAQAAGVPVVASDVGGLPEAIADGETGILVEAGEVDPLADALNGLLDDPSRRARLGAAGPARVRARFDADTMAAATVALYERLASPEGASASLEVESASDSDPSR